MRETVVRRDRYTATITEGANLLTIEAGTLRARLRNPVDPCESCTARLLE